MKSRITFIDSTSGNDTPGVGGTSDINWCLAKILAKRNHIAVVGPYTKGVRNPEPSVNIIPMPEAIVRRSNIAKHLIRAFQLSYCAKRSARADIYHVPDCVTAAALAALGLGDRVIWHGHSNIDHHSQHGIPWDKSMYALMRGATSFAAKRISRVVALGPSLVPWWQKSGFSYEQISVIPNGIDLIEDRVVSQKLDKVSIFQKNAYRLLYVGRLSAEKGGYYELIDAVVDLNRDIPVSLVFVGDGPYRDEIEQSINKRNLTDIISCVEHQTIEAVHQIYRIADLVVLPSRGEMMPRVMLEAWAAGTAFMATAVGAIPDYLIDNENGFLLTSLDKVYLRQRLHKALTDTDLRSRVAQQGRATAQAMPWSRVAEQFSELYTSVIATLRA
jgi:glycosyltransferase involved in cell wall biosynthesis